MNQVLRVFFNPPPFPELRMPIPARLVPGFKRTIEEIYTKVYFTGATQGFALGVLVTLMFVPSIKRSLSKGVADVHQDL